MQHTRNKFQRNMLHTHIERVHLCFVWGSGQKAFLLLGFLSYSCLSGKTVLSRAGCTLSGSSLVSTINPVFTFAVCSKEHKLPEGPLIGRLKETGSCVPLLQTERGACCCGSPPVTNTTPVRVLCRLPLRRCVVVFWQFWIFICLSLRWNF